MDNKIAALPRAPDPGFSQVSAGEPPAKASEPPVALGPDPVDLRLVIEDDQASGSYIYKTINRVTGEILQQFPRAEILKLREGLNYAAGSVVNTEA